MKKNLNQAKVERDDSEYYKKHVATMANLKAAIECNHKKKIPKKWRESLNKKRDRLKKMKERWSAKKRPKTLEAINKQKLKIKEMKATKDYNLRTSLKSYIDPRVVHKWSKKVDYDWKLYYPKILQKKFSWIEMPPGKAVKQQ
jgi:DNA topoisomerase-1